MKTESAIKRDYKAACAKYADLGVDLNAALAALDGVAVSVNCWQGDDVQGFEKGRGALSGGILVTGQRPGRARNAGELRADIEAAMSLIPGRHRLNLHAMYADSGRPKDRDKLEPEHFKGWMDWSRTRGIPLDFNATCFSHPKADSGYTLTSDDEDVRSFWIEHCVKSREVAAAMGEAQGGFCMHNLWIPDGSKDDTMFRFRRCELLKDSLDRIYSAKHSAAVLKDSVESKLFGIGSETFVPGSHEFYSAYALRNGLIPCLDMGHFHPTESVADKIPALLVFFPELLVHVSRGVRWDSDHVPVSGNMLTSLCCAIVRNSAHGKVHLALDFFDGGMNRVGAWALAARALLRSMLSALLEPIERLRAFEAEGDRFAMLALIEESRAMPSGAVWDFHCLRSGAPLCGDWIDRARKYEARISWRRMRCCPTRC